MISQRISPFIGRATMLVSVFLSSACVSALEPPVPAVTETFDSPTISTEPIPFTVDAPFASEIYNFFVQDELFQPTTCRTVFTGSSSIRFWLTLDEDFPELAPLNRGFGG